MLGAITTLRSNKNCVALMLKLKTLTQAMRDRDVRHLPLLPSSAPQPLLLALKVFLE